MYRTAEAWADIRQRVFVEGVGKRQIFRETGLHRQTLQKMLTHSEPPRTGPPARSVDPAVEGLIRREALRIFTDPAVEMLRRVQRLRAVTDPVLESVVLPGVPGGVGA